MTKNKELSTMELLVDYKGKTFSDSDESLMYLLGLLHKSYDNGFENGKDTFLEKVKKIVDDYILDSVCESQEFKSLCDLYKDIVGIKDKYNKK